MSQSWDGGSAVFDCSIDIDENITAPSEIFIPAEYIVSAVHRDGVVCNWHKHDRGICLKEKSSGHPASFKIYLHKNSGQH
jgi:hypothetical protein